MKDNILGYLLFKTIFKREAQVTRQPIEQATVERKN